MTLITDRIHNGLGDGFRQRIFARSLWQATVTTAERTATALFVWLERARQRRELLGLGDRALSDFGASRCDATGEGDKPFWRR
jgi:uncharacterized protein YjiS (DUF1127 family)